MPCPARCGSVRAASSGRQASRSMARGGIVLRRNLPAGCLMG
jgi:hypothetical protein